MTLTLNKITVSHTDVENNWLVDGVGNTDGSCNEYLSKQG